MMQLIKQNNEVEERIWLKSGREEPFDIISRLSLFRDRRVFTNLIFTKSNLGHCFIMNIIHKFPKLVYFAKKG